ncbi:hypothetical protein PDESU_01951 [Pontiella desulfatans]|uniref:Uncharacterized protein n=1 Tax=Pontiella desulfatans TaxID=2750659 RepID=A0A6C2U156_PONDE|nr:hypothetical protein PDESU_01951 [Pontiella desulfatans]
MGLREGRIQVHKHRIRVAYITIVILYTYNHKIVKYKENLSTSAPKSEETGFQRIFKSQILSVFSHNTHMKNHL